MQTNYWNFHGIQCHVDTNKESLMQKTVFITGGSTGIGNACVRKFHACGWDVAFMDVNADAGMKTAEELGNVLFLSGDTRSKADLETAVARTVEAFGGIDGIVANAGIHRCNTLLDISDDELDMMIDVNIRGTVNTLRAAVPCLKRGGSVVINASDQCYVGKANSFGYGLTKGAIGQIARSLAIDLGPRGIRVNAVCAGTIRTPLTESLFQRFADITHGGSVDAYWQAEAEQYPLGRVGEASEVAELVFFLASDAASFMTGGLYLADGGLVAK